MENDNDILTAYNSPAIEKRLSEIRDRKGKNAFLESIMSNPNAKVLNETNGHKTTLFPENKGANSSSWKKTKQMAFELNENCIDVAFLPELLSSTIVLKLENMDSGLFKDAIDYLLRNEIPYGNIILLNNYGKALNISRKEFKTGIYKKRIRGFL